MQFNKATFIGEDEGMLSSDIFRFHAVNEKDPTGVKQFIRNEEESKTAESKREQTGESLS